MAACLRQCLDYSKGAWHVCVFPPHLRNPIMDAGYNLTLLWIVYVGTEQLVEPYSLEYKTRKYGIAPT